MYDSDYYKYKRMLEDIRDDRDYDTDKKKKQIRALFRDMYANYGSNDEQVRWLEREYEWYL